MREIRVAIMGFGGMAAQHKAAYDRLYSEGRGVRLVAICDKNPKCLETVSTTNLGTVVHSGFDGISFYTDPDRMLECEEFDAVDICLPTFLHKEYSIRFLRAGKHVLCEKPMALSFADCAEMVRTSRECDRRLMVGQCLRFDPAYLYLKSLVDGGELGAVRRVRMGRLSYMPAWGGWFSDPNKSGGAIIDFHIHDLDMLRFIFGEPRAVSSVAYAPSDGWQYVTSRFFYDGMITEAEASFDESSSTPFSMWYRVRFDRATVLFETDRVTVYPDSGEPYEPALDATDRITAELSYFASVVRGETENKNNPPESAALSIALAEAVRESALDGGSRKPFIPQDFN